MKQFDDRPVKVKIEHTYEYAKFKLVGINRKVDVKHVITIAEAIALRNLLHLFPLIINSDWEVMDGQHRLSAVIHIQASKLLNLPVYYIMDENITMDDISLLNSNKINWKNLDYVNYYAGKGVPAFKALQKFMTNHPKINLSSAVELVSNKKRDLKELKVGVLSADKADKAEVIIGYVYDLKSRMDSQAQFWKSGNFISAVQRVVNTKRYSHKVMMDSPLNTPENWEQQSSSRNYIFEINRIYNHGRTEREKIDFKALTR